MRDDWRRCLLAVLGLGSPSDDARAAKVDDAASPTSGTPGEVGEAAMALPSSDGFTVKDVSRKCLCAGAGPEDVALPSSACGKELVSAVMALENVFLENQVTPGKNARGGAMRRTLRTGGAWA